MPSLVVDRMRPEDLDQVLAIERASFSMPWSRGAFLYEMQQNRVARCWVTRDHEGVAGYICLWEVGEELHITNVAVRLARRRRGIGRSLLEGVLADARNRQVRLVVLEVRPTNVEAIGLYESLGFQVIGRRRGYYYDTGEDALVMQLDLVQQPAGRQPGGPGNRR